MMGYGPKSVALRVTALWIWVEDALGRKRVVKNSTQIKVRVYTYQGCLRINMVKNIISKCMYIPRLSDESCHVSDI
jgi:hypothetical protein